MSHVCIQTNSTLTTNTSTSAQMCVLAPVICCVHVGGSYLRARVAAINDWCPMYVIPCQTLRTAPFVVILM